ncbi:MAG: shikimate kinase [Myxococcota bacterium]
MSRRTPHSELRSNLALIGGRGCGKSSIAKRLARRNRHFMLFCLDALIRYEAGGRSIPEIVASQGWPGFRDLEFDVVQKVSGFRDSALLDCGGGVVVDLDASGQEVFSERKVDALRAHARVVYLERDPDYLERRVGIDPNRPALSETRTFREILEQRDPWYRRAAHLTLECGDLSKSELTERILRWFYDETGVDGDPSLASDREN